MTGYKQDTIQNASCEMVTDNKGQQCLEPRKDLILLDESKHISHPTSKCTQDHLVFESDIEIQNQLKLAANFRDPIAHKDRCLNNVVISHLQCLL